MHFGKRKPDGGQLCRQLQRLYEDPPGQDRLDNIRSVQVVHTVRASHTQLLLQYPSFSVSLKPAVLLKIWPPEFEDLRQFRGQEQELERVKRQLRLTSNPVKELRYLREILPFHLGALFVKVKPLELER